jgi:hypothetical protein
MRHMIYLSSLFSLICISCVQQKSIILSGVWKLERDTTISIMFNEDSAYTFLSDSLILREKFVFLNEIKSNPKLILYSENDSSECKVLGLTDSTLTLMDNMQGKILFYTKVK